MKPSGKADDEQRPVREQITKLERALAAAHQRQETPPFSPTWGSSVMRDIRLQADSGRTPAEIPRLVWRAAAIVAFVSLLLAGSALTWNAERADAGFLALFNDATWDPTVL
jgi:hypothetical protein